jgi:hypothetical protein
VKQELFMILLDEKSSNSLSEVFMEFAGESRYAILTKLEEQKWRSAPLAKELGLTIQETHRNTVRLADSGLKSISPRIYLLSFFKELEI